MDKETSTFQTALETIERLTLEEREFLFEIAYHRYVKERRTYLAGEIAEVRSAQRLPKR